MNFKFPWKATKSHYESFWFEYRTRDTDEKTNTKAAENQKALKESRKVVINFRLCFVYLHPYVLYHVERSYSKTRVICFFSSFLASINDVTCAQRDSVGL